MILMKMGYQRKKQVVWIKIVIVLSSKLFPFFFFEPIQEQTEPHIFWGVLVRHFGRKVLNKFYFVSFDRFLEAYDSSSLYREASTS